VGKLYSPAEIVEEVARDAMFYRRDSGGMTLSGGEILMQVEGAVETLRLCKEQMMDTAIETSTYGSWEQLERLLPLSNTVFADLKHIDSRSHRRLTGVPNRLVLENIRKLAAYAAAHDWPRMILRLPVIPGLNNDRDTMARTAEFIAGLPGKTEANLLPYHPMGANKYKMIDLDYPLESLEKPDKETMIRYQEVIRSRAPHCHCTVGGSEITY
jgi:pyruvate formate lyase activating enzyme